MSNQMQDRSLENHDNVQPVKRWFVPALVGIAVVGALLVYLATRYYGPSDSVLQTDSQTQGEAAIQKAGAQLMKAAQARKEGKLQESMTILDQLLKEHPEITAAHIAAGEVAMQLKDLDRAQKEFEIVQLATPEDGQAAAYLTAIAVLKKDYPAARSLLEKTMAGPNLQRNGQYAYGTLVLKAACYADQPDIAMDTIRQALQAAGRNEIVIFTARIYGPQLLLYVAQVLQEQHPADAATAYAVAAETARQGAATTQPSSGSATAWSAKAAELYLQAGRPRQARNQIALALQAEPQNPAYTSLQERITTALATQPTPASQPNTQ